MAKKSKVKNREKSDVESGIKIGIAGGLLASICCIGPVVVILLGLGVGSITFALYLSQYKLHFLALSTVFVAFAIVLYLKKKSKTCGMNCLSPEGIRRERNFVIRTVVIMLVFYLFMMYVLTPSIIGILG